MRHCHGLPKSGNDPNTHQRYKGWGAAHTYNGIQYSNENKGTTAIDESMSESPKHFVEPKGARGEECMSTSPFT